MKVSSLKNKENLLLFINKVYEQYSHTPWGIRAIKTFNDNDIVDFYDNILSSITKIPLFFTGDVKYDMATATRLYNDYINRSDKKKWLKTSFLSYNFDGGDSYPTAFEEAYSDFHKGVTIELIKQKYREFNERFFNNELTPIPIKIVKKKSFGQYVYTIRYGKVYESHIEISDKYKSSDMKDIENTLIHEMVHQYVAEVIGSVYEGHGPKFLAVADRINKMSNYIIKVRGYEDDNKKIQSFDITPHLIFILKVDKEFEAVKLEMRPISLNLLPHLMNYIPTYYGNKGISVAVYVSFSQFFIRYKKFRVPNRFYDISGAKSTIVKKELENALKIISVKTDDFESDKHEIYNTIIRNLRKEMKEYGDVVYKKL